MKVVNIEANPQPPSVKARLSTNTLSYKNRVQRWGNFIAGYSVEFVEQCLLSKCAEGGTVIDPFMGCGTTLVAARNLGFSSIGYDRHPVFFSLSAAKLGNYTVSDLKLVESKLRSSACSLRWSEDAAKFLEKMFLPETLEQIGRSSAAINMLPSQLRELGVAVFLRACEASCGAQTDGIYKAPATLKRAMPFGDALDLVISEFYEDVNSSWYRDHWVSQPSSVLFNKSSTEIEELEQSSVDICVTSPPYLNNFDYAEMTRMHLYLLGWAGSWGEISEGTRNHLITNTTTALKGKKSPEYQASCRSILPPQLLGELDEIVRMLADERRQRLGKKEYDSLVYVYYAQILKVLEGVFRAMKLGAEIHWVVADAALYGVHIKTHTHTAEIMKALGFVDVSIDMLRPRGHRWVLTKRDGAKEGLGEYHITARKGVR